MAASTSRMMLPATMLQRGFWLYVWRVQTVKGELLYVGRTGDNSSPHATAPYTRMGQHLGFIKTQNALRKHLKALGIEPEDCASFQLVAHGPLYPEVSHTTADRAERMKAHIPLRDKVGAMEKALAEALAAAGYRVLNTVKCKWPLDLDAWAPVREAFAADFPRLARGGQRA